MGNIVRGGVEKETIESIKETATTIVCAVNTINTKETALYEMVANWGYDNDQPVGDKHGEKAQKIIQKAKEVIDERKYLAYLYDELGKMLGINYGNDPAE